ncbi:MAG: hypothetical protein ABR563_07060 [Pyrinomonadaceae bacterium]
MSTERGRRAKERRRSRIVVNVDEAPPRRKGRRDPDRTEQLPLRRRVSKRGRRRLFVAACVAAALSGASLVAAYLWYQSDKATPTYSLALLADAAGRGDRAAVDQLLDVDAATRSLVPQVVAKVSGQAAQQDGQQGAQTSALAQVPASVRRYVAANAGVLIPGARDAVRDALVAEIKQGAAKRVGDYPFFVAALLAHLAPDSVNAQGDLATVSFKSNSQPVTLTMQRSGAGDRWRVIAIESDELATRIADNLSRGLPALGR